MLKFFLPNFEDLVDPEYDFELDKQSPSHKNRRTHDRYAHEFFPSPIFDGMLVSKASLSFSAQRDVVASGGIRQFTRLHPDLPIMGDCGAFTYLLEEKPIYTVPDVLKYYQDFGFNYGVSLDHLAFVTIEMLEAALTQGKIKQRWWQNKTTEQIRMERFELTLKNAQEFLDLSTKQKLSFIPVGIAQGGTPELYADAVRRLINMGYGYIAIGGLVRSSDKDIIAILKEIQPLIKHGVQLHIFGVARLSLIPDFVKLGVTSADSASPLRRAFLGTGEDNYWAMDGSKYAAIRVPEANTKRIKRGLDHPGDVVANGDRPVDSIEALTKMEQNVLNLLRFYDQGKSKLDETLEALLNYDRLFGDGREYDVWYRRTLENLPWKKCNCPICKKIGIEVMIFRGNNRNRRRGFHNVKVFYDQLHNLLQKLS